jgi:hypothetical protein
MITIRYDILTGETVDAEGRPVAVQVRLPYQSAPLWRLILGVGDALNGTFTPQDMSDAVAWASAVDDDFDHTTDPMVRTLDADIDSSAAASGIVDVRLDANTSTFQEVVAGLNFKREVFFEVRGLDSETPPRVLYYAKFQILADNTIDPSGGTPPAPVGNYPTWTEFYAALRSKKELEYSVDGLTDWHETQVLADRYFRSRYPEGDWTDAILLPLGITWRGDYAAGTTYALQDAVYYEGKSYISIQAANTGNAPDETDSEWWDVLAGGDGKPDLEFVDGDLGEGDILAVPGQDPIAAVLDADGNVQGLVPIMYGSPITQVDLSAFAPLTGTWRIKFATGAQGPQGEPGASLDIPGLDEKTTLVDNDLFVISDSQASGALKKVKRENVGGGGGGGDLDTSAVILTTWAFNA